MRLALILTAVLLAGCQTAPPVPFVKGPSHAFNGRTLAGAEVSNRDLMNQRGRGTAEQPRAQLTLPPGFAPQPGFLY